MSAADLFALFSGGAVDTASRRMWRNRSDRRRLALTWSRRPVQHPLVTLAERAPPMSVANLLRDHPRFYRTPAEARRWARNRRKHARGKAARS